MSFLPYTASNAQRFYLSVKSWISSIKESHEEFDFDVVKQRRPRNASNLRLEDGRPFSVLKLNNLKTLAIHYFAISNMQMHEGGTNGRIKVAYPMKHRSGWCGIDFDNPVALKVFNKHPKIADPSIELNEAQIYFHEHIPGFMHALRYDVEKYYYIMPLETGACLFDYVSAAGLISFSQFFSIAIKAASEIEKVHLRNYGHYDIKPENFIIYDKDGKMTLSLIDFDQVTAFGSKVFKAGTLEYMAPEVMIADQVETKADYRADIYSFVSTLNALLGCTVEVPSRIAHERLYGYLDEMLLTRPKISRVKEILLRLAKLTGTPIYPEAEKVVLWKPNPAIRQERYLAYRFKKSPVFGALKPADLPNHELSPSKRQNTMQATTMKPGSLDV